MKQRLLLFTAASGLNLAACQQQPAVKTAAVVPAEIVVSVAPTPKLIVVDTAHIATPLLTPEMREFLSKYSVSALWKTAAEGNDSPVINGFFGEDHYRIEFVFTSLTQDPVDKSLFHVTGQNRYRRTITPFSGSIQLNQIQNQPAEDSLGEVMSANSHIASGTFRFVEQSGKPTDGLFEGTTALDFYVNEGGKLERDYSRGSNYGALGSGYKFEGIWTGNNSSKTKPVLFADNFLELSNTVLKDFAIGERDVSINPKYAKLGWDTYWENDEWWAAPGPATARAAAPNNP